MNQQAEEQEQEEPETSLRDDMEAAISQVEETDGTSAGDDYVEETPKVEKEEAQEPQNVDTSPGTADQAAAATDEKPGAVDVKAPQSWSPKLREEFGKLSPGVQAQINKRETEMSTFLNEGAESRKFGDKMGQALQPYQAVMSAHGTNDPVQAVQGLMETATMLQMGSPQQKAQKLADMVQHYGIDINMLDGALSGQPQTNPQQSQMEQMLEQKLAPMTQFMNTVQQNQTNSQQQVHQNAQTEVGTFEQTAEFIGDVRNDMADMLDMAAQRGQTMSLQEAYDKACAINPEISAVITQRANDDRLKGNQQSNNNKRYAASSIRGNQTGGGGHVENATLGSALNQAWDDSMGS
jgi:hypothetical protein